MKVHALLFSILLLITNTSFAEFYVVYGPTCPIHHYIRHHYHVHHYYRHTYIDWWAVKHRHCYDPDLTTGDDDPCIYPDMDIDE